MKKPSIRTPKEEGQICECRESARVKAAGKDATNREDDVPDDERHLLPYDPAVASSKPSRCPGEGKHGEDLEDIASDGLERRRKQVSVDATVREREAQRRTHDSVQLRDPKPLRAVRVLLGLEGERNPGVGVLRPAECADRRTKRVQPLRPL
jgi:hypothetical protein